MSTGLEVTRVSRPRPAGALQALQAMQIDSIISNLLSACARGGSVAFPLQKQAGKAPYTVIMGAKDGPLDTAAVAHTPVGRSYNAGVAHLSSPTWLDQSTRLHLSNIIVGGTQRKFARAVVRS